MSPVDWSRWTVILLKPDCVARGLVDDVLAWVAREVTVTGQKTLTVTSEQIFAHYDDMLAPHLSAEFGFDIAADLRRLYVGHQVAVALGHGDGAAPRVRRMLGDTDPSLAGTDTIRGYFGVDSLATARGENRLINNVIHTSDHEGVVERDFGIWYGPSHLHLLANLRSAS
ncbi:nucleoside-diphosphate kinase [Sphaerisporangium album]|uniref:nucleoside-diphosphate kinase n=1 Tax=Sphaerisporangium album TaxID=509200 RepID=UPI001C6913EA|nr:nucleoside-diphosphate kinase [Sphaerisporangium album]